KSPFDICVYLFTSISKKVSTLLGYMQKELGVKHVSTRSLGTNHIDIAYAEHVGIQVESIFYSPESIADFTLALLLMMVRNMSEIFHNTKNNNFNLPHQRGKALSSLNVGVIGNGRIGKEVIKRLEGFGSAQLIFDHKKWTEKKVTFDQLLKESDVITLHVPLNSDTYHLIGEKEFRKMKAGAILINTSRGAIVDTQAMITALQDGNLGGAALDVIEDEEALFHKNSCEKKGSKILDIIKSFPNVILTPHIAYYTDKTLEDLVDNTCLSYLEFERRNRFER
uniref:NAD(P)-dependent oxidoreductase n=1 Tax=Listeria valentina TaxID=2705293 RepID=UPI001AD91F41